MQAAQLKQFQIELGYLFKQPALLRQALTHRSSSADHYERLEFLGDAILGLVITDYLYQQFPQAPEGELSRTRSHLVREESLAAIAEKLKLSELIVLGDGELKSGGFKRPSILADALEAIFGAVFADAGFEQAKKTILQIYAPNLASVKPAKLAKDAKTNLQEWAQQNGVELPVYQLDQTTGAAHEKTFEVTALLAAQQLSAKGAGASRRAAEQIAAQALLDKLAQANLLQPKKTLKKSNPMPQGAPRKQLKLKVATEQITQSNGATQ